jgi:hypothetical protein
VVVGVQQVNLKRTARRCECHIGRVF